MFCSPQLWIKEQNWIEKCHGSFEPVMFHNLRNAVMCLWTWVGSNSALIAQTLARLHILRTKNLENKTKKTQHPHQVESSVDSIVRRHKSANRKSFLNSASVVLHLKMRMILPMKSQRWQDQQRGPTSLMREHRRETSSALWTSSAQPVLGATTVGFALLHY